MEISAAQERIEKFIGSRCVVTANEKGLLLELSCGKIALCCPVRGVQNRKRLFSEAFPFSSDLNPDDYEWGNILKIGIDESDYSLRIFFESGMLLSAHPANIGYPEIDLCWIAFFDRFAGESQYIVGLYSGINEGSGGRVRS